MKKKWLMIFIAGGMISLLNAECTNMPIGTEVAKSIMSRDIDQAKKFLTAYKTEVSKFLEQCKDGGAQQQVKLMQLTYEDEVKYLEENLKKKNEATYDCTKVPDDAALKSAFSSGNAENIKKAYSAYKKNVLDYLDQCATHEEYEMVYDTSLLHDDEYNKWEKSAK